MPVPELSRSARVPGLELPRPRAELYSGHNRRNGRDGPRAWNVADIFVSYNKSDRTDAFWVDAELSKLGHTPHLHEKEIKGGQDFIHWMMERLDKGDHTLC